MINSYSAGNATTGNPTNLYNAGVILKSIDAVETLDRVVKTIDVPMNKSELINLQRAVTPEPRTTEVAEGVTPSLRSVTYENVQTTMEEFVEVFALTSRQAELGESDVLKDSKDRLTDLVKRTREKNAWFTYRTGTNRLFNSNAHSSRSQVNGPITLGRLRVASRILTDNRAQYVRKISNGVVNQGTTAMEAAYLCLAHTSCRPDIRALPGFVPLAQIGGASRDIPSLFGQVDDVMFITSPEFEPFYGEGAAVGATNMRSAGGVNIDVYSYLVFGAEALGKCTLRGASSSGAGGITLKAYTEGTKEDPGNQRRVVACRWWDAPVILNQQHVVRIEAGVTDNVT